jgi:tetratricopeptide (TPR) repeat protein
MLRILLIFAVTSALAGAWAGEAKAFVPTADQKACAAVPANADVVAACTRIIEAPDSSTLDRAASYNFRAEATRNGGDLNAAIADYNQALTLMPALVPALNGRGIAYRNAQNYDLSLQDFNKAISLKPGDSDLYNGRGQPGRREPDGPTRSMNSTRATARTSQRPPR